MQSGDWLTSVRLSVFQQSTDCRHLLIALSVQLYVQRNGRLGVTHSVARVRLR